MRLISLALVLGVALGVLVWSTGDAGAHSEYERSEPADGAVLEESPPRVDVWYSQELRRSGGMPVLMVVKDNGDQVDLGAILDDEDRHHLYAELAPALPRGRYTVIYNVLSDEDAEATWGAFHFYVGEGPGAASETPGDPVPPTQAPASSPGGTGSTPTPVLAPPVGVGEGDDSDDSGLPLWTVFIGAVGGLVIGAGAGTFVGRRSRE